MTVVNHDTGEIVERPSYSQVRDSIAAAREAGAKFFEQIVWQVERRAWEVLGHADWDAMREAEYADMGVVVPRADRPEIVTRMRRVGLTHQEIADTLGVNRKTVASDLDSMSESDIDLPDVIETPRGPRPTRYSKTPEAGAETGAADVDDPVLSRGNVEGQSDEDCPEAPAQVPACPPAPEPSPVSRFLENDGNVQLTGWRRNFMAAIARSGELMLFAPEDVASNADVDLINELERLSLDLNKYVSRVQARRPRRLTAIDGGNR